MFKKNIIETPTNLFEELSNSADFEDITKGRKGANLVDKNNNLIPIVRTTTVYQNSNQKFSLIHYDIINSIKKFSEYQDLELNNALIEIYDSKYCNMCYHSDQALDLADDSHICIFSCYNDPTTTNLRKLKIKNKITNVCSDILLEHNSVVIFSVDTNREYLHKIVLGKNTSDNNLWLGITFRKSKTFIYFDNGLPYFKLTNKPLLLANQAQRTDFFKCRGAENSNVSYTYPQLDYTISTGDLVIVE